MRGYASIVILAAVLWHLAPPAIEAGDEHTQARRGLEDVSS